MQVDLYGRETWSLTLREEHRLSVFDNRVLRRIFGLKRDEMKGGWRSLHNQELHNPCQIYENNYIKWRRWPEHAARTELKIIQSLGRRIWWMEITSRS
jgi:PAS domain-containing protein